MHFPKTFFTLALAAKPIFANSAPAVENSVDTSKLRNSMQQPINVSVSAYLIPSNYKNGSHGRRSNNIVDFSPPSPAHPR